MQQIFLIGDSIRLGYRAQVAEELKDRAQVFSADDNARFTAYTLRYLHEWATLCAHPENIAVVHWNNGLWDACHFDGDEEPITPLDEYLHNIIRIRKKLGVLFPNARVIFATSTKVAPGHPRISNAELDVMNEKAVALLSKQGVLIDDLNAIIDQHPEYICPDQTHMTKEGFTALGKAVAREIVRAL